MTPANGHIEVDSYTVTVGHTKVHIQRRGAMWTVGYYGDPALGADFPDGDTEPMMAVAVEYAKRLDAAFQAVKDAEAQIEEVHQWLRNSVYGEQP